MTTDPEQQLIDDGIAARQYLESEAGRRLVERRNLDSFKEWMLSNSTDEREHAYAKFKAFNDFVAEMEAVNRKGNDAESRRAYKAKVAAQPK